MDPDRKRLTEHIEARAEQLRLSWRAIAAAAGMTEQNLLRIRQGTIGLTEKAVIGLDNALLWEPGGARRALQGREPIPRREDATTLLASIDDPEVSGVVSWSARQLAEYVIELDRLLGAETAKAFLLKAVQLQNEWAQQQSKEEGTA